MLYIAGAIIQEIYMVTVSSQTHTNNFTCLYFLSPDQQRKFKTNLDCHLILYNTFVPCIHTVAVFGL